MSIVIAIDGTAASGKGTLARNLAAHFDYAYLDTGALYRAVGVAVCEAGENPEHEAAAVRAAQELDFRHIDEAKIRTAQAGLAAAKTARIEAVREILRHRQRDFASHPPAGKMGAVIDGRDIGTIICPDAEVKFFVTATPQIRAKRRFKELSAASEEVTYEQLLADIIARDKSDQERAHSPLKKAADAHLLDTSNLSIEGVLNAALAFIGTKSNLQST